MPHKAKFIVYLTNNIFKIDSSLENDYYGMHCQLFVEYRWMFEAVCVNILCKRWWVMICFERNGKKHKITNTQLIKSCNAFNIYLYMAYDNLLLLQAQFNITTTAISSHVTAVNDCSIKSHHFLFIEKSLFSHLFHYSFYFYFWLKLADVWKCCVEPEMLLFKCEIHRC